MFGGRFELERIANKASNLVLNRIAGGVPGEQFLKVAALDGPARSCVACDMLKLGAEFDIHVTELFSQTTTVVT